MFTLFFNFHIYRFLKSGFLVDFFLKKSVYYALRYLLMINNIFFSEKFLVEQTFLQVTKFINYLNFYFDYLSNENTYSALSIAIFSFFLCLVFLLRFEFTRIQFIYIF